jgi:hypothetical protein
MNRFISIMVIVLLLSVSSAYAGVRTWPWASPSRELSLAQEVDKVVATLVVSLNNSPAIVEIDSAVEHDTHTVTLSFSIIQNRDLFVRSMRWETLRWEIPGITKEQYRFQLKGCYLDLSTVQLNGLTGKR